LPSYNNNKSNNNRNIYTVWYTVNMAHKYCCKASR